MELGCNLGEWQMSLRGLLMGRGTPYRIKDAPQGTGVAPVRTSDLPYLSADGVYAAGDFLGARNITVGLVVLGSTPAEADALARALSGAWGPSTSDVAFRFRLADAQSYLVWGRPRRCELDYSTLKHGHVLAAVMFTGTDPLLYCGAGGQAVIPLGSGTPAGAAFDLTYDVRFQAEGAVPPGVASLLNRGTAPTAPVLTIAGEVVDPRVENLTTGETMELDLSLVSTDVVEVDMAARTVKVNGANALGVIAPGSTFWKLAPGENLVAFRAPVDTTVATCTVTYRSAWY